MLEEANVKHQKEVNELQNQVKVAVSYRSFSSLSFKDIPVLCFQALRKSSKMRGADHLGTMIRSGVEHSCPV